MSSDLYQQYQSQAVSQADPIKLVEMLYEGAIRFTNRAKKAIADGEMEAAHNNILRAYAIISELMATLDFEQGGEVAVSLEQCYDYVLHLYREANIKKDCHYLDEALKMLEPLLASWAQAFENGLPESVRVIDGKPTAVAPGEPTPERIGAKEPTVKADQEESSQPAPHQPLDLTG